MGHTIHPIRPRRHHRGDWRERLIWTSLSVVLLAALLAGLIAWAEWMDRSGRFRRFEAAQGGVLATPIPGAVVADLLAPPMRPVPARPAEVEVHARLSPVQVPRAAEVPPDEAAGRRCYAVDRVRVDGAKPIEAGGELCVVVE